jgi:hypothetical protein
MNSYSLRCTARVASKEDKRGEEKEDHAPTPHVDLDGLFESPTVDFDLRASPTPRRRHSRIAS